MTDFKMKNDSCIHTPYIEHNNYNYVWNSFQCVTLFKLFTGLLNMTPLNCDIMQEGVCMKYVKRGQPVLLCTKDTTMPSKIPQGKHALSISNSVWMVNNRGVSKTLYTCSRDSCQLGSNFSDVNYTRYSVVTAKCLAVADVQEDEVYVLKVYYNPLTSHVSNVSFHMNYDGELFVPDPYSS